jgi:predicted lysophospholipase L1 biosynthesis ABC-type transport system permease subunit
MQAEGQIGRAAPERLIGGAGQRQVQLPFRKALSIAVQNIRVRFWRSMITAGGVLLGIAFLSSTFGQSMIAEHAVVQRAAVDEAARRIQEQEAHARQIWLVVMSLIVCTVGITNSMLMSVTERFKEIGTMKCLGALDSFIVKLFLIEACILGMTASLIGYAIGFGFALLVGVIQEGARILGRLPGGPIAAAFGWCLLVGALLTVLATIFPAIRASKLPPAAALRVEV